MGGAFSGLDKVIRDRSEKSGIGFSAHVKSKDDARNVGEVLQKVEAEDLIHYGLIPEFVGRLPVIATLEELDQDALVRILREPKNAITKQYEKLFSMEDCELEFREEALYAVAEKASARKTGARGLRTILENVLLETMYELPQVENVTKVVVDGGVVRGESKPYLLLEGRDPMLAETQYKKAASDE